MLIAPKSASEFFVVVPANISRFGFFPLVNGIITILIITILWVQRGGGALKECAITLALSLGLIAGGGAPYAAVAANPAIPQVSVLISGPPIKDPGALLRYALPIDNKPIREVQKPLEDITDSLKIAGVKALDSVERVSY